MNEVFIAIMESSVTMSALAILYLVMTPFISKRYAAKSLYFTWLIVAIGFLIPFRFRLPQPIINIQAPILEEIPLSPANLAPAAHTLPAGAASWDISLLAVICALWLMGTILFLTRHLHRHWKFLRLVKRWGEDAADSEIIAILESVRSRLAITQPVCLRTCAGISSPMLIGFLKPTILLGIQRIPESELPLIFEHELVHFKRRDLWVKVLVLLTTSLHWFNPIAHIMAREISMACELSCDAEVMKNIDIDGRKHYAESIIGIIRRQAPAQTLLCTNFYSGKQGMKKRILSIMNGNYRKLGLLLPALILLLTLNTGTVFALERPQTAPPTPAKTVLQPAANPAPVLVPEAQPPVISAVRADADNKVSTHIMEANSIAIYESSPDSPWTLKQGERVTLVLELEEAEPSEQLSIGYVFNEKTIELFTGTVKDGVEIIFTAPQNGDFRFYAENLSKTAVSVKAFSFIPASSLIKDNGYPILEASGSSEQLQKTN